MNSSFGVDLFRFLEEDDPSPTRSINSFIHSNLIPGEEAAVQPSAKAASSMPLSKRRKQPPSSVPSAESSEPSDEEPAPPKARPKGVKHHKAAAGPKPPPHPPLVKADPAPKRADPPPPPPPLLPPPPPPRAPSARKSRCPSPPWRKKLKTEKAKSAASQDLPHAQQPKPKAPPTIGPPECEYDPVFQKIEAENAKRFGIPPHQRGPPEPADKSTTWKGMIWDDTKKQWRYTHRSQLPREYYDAFPTYDDWWTKLELEAELAWDLMIPALLRGPPHGPPPEDPRRTWRNSKWRKEAQKWCNRAGQHQGARNAVFWKGSWSSSGTKLHPSVDG